MEEKSNSLGLQTYFSENYDLQLALKLSRSESEAKKQADAVVHNFENILPPIDALEVIKERLNLFYS